MKKIIFFINLLCFSVAYSQLPIGQNLFGKHASQEFGRSVSLNSDGTVMAVGLNTHNNGMSSGSVKIYRNVNNVWTQLGEDLMGEKSYDHFGATVSLNSDGKIIGVGAFGSDGNGDRSGHVAIYQYNNGVWTQIGQNIDGEHQYNGASFLSLNSTGDVVAIGSPANADAGKNAGHVRVFKNESGVWTQIGNDIDGEAAEDLSGGALKISADGNILAIGAWGNDGNGEQSGHTRVYQNVSGVWTQLGNDIDGEALANRSGYSLDLSADGKTVAIGAFMNNNQFDRAGHVRVYHYQNNIWSQIGGDIDGEAQDDNSGKGVSMSEDGKIVAIGAPFNDGNGNDAGNVKIFQNIANNWIQIGNDIDGAAASEWMGSIISLSGDGTTLAIGIPRTNTFVTKAGRVRVFRIERTEGDTEAPVITSGTEISVDENIGENQEIYTITATDNVGIVSYAISGDDASSFALNETSGIITLNENPDYETKSSYIFSVTASDTAGNTSTLVEVTLNIIDVDEEDVVFSQIGTDILGNDEYDEFGKLVKISKDGKTLIAGSFFTGENNQGDCDYVKVYENINNSWQQKGSTLEFLCSFGYGRSLSISEDGNVIAIGINSMPQGQPALARVFEFQNNDWVQLGSDIQGEETSNGFANSISLNDSGNRLAVGVPYAKKDGVILGKIKIFEFTNTDWEHLGDDILGEDEREYFGISVDFDSSGATVISGAIEKEINSSSGGQAKVFQFDGTNWNQLGQDIKGEPSGGATRFGASVSMNSDGTVVAISAPYDDGNGSSSGHIRVYEYKDTLWEQQGEDIDGSQSSDLSGWQNGISLSDDGKTIAIGAYANDGNGSASGQVRIFKYSSQNWSQFGEDIYGEAKGDYFGRTLGLSGDGSILAVGGQRNDTNGENAGHVKVYNLSGNTTGNPISNDNLLAYYPFNGDVNDNSGNGYHGDLVGGAFTADSSGNTNTALELDGVDDFVNLSSFAKTYRDNISKLSVYFKVKFTKEDNNQTILSLGNSGESLATNVFEIEYENNRLQVETEVGAATTNHEIEIDEANTLFDDEWHEILLTFDADNLKYYKDGTLIFDDTYMPAVTESEDLFLGSFGSTSPKICCFAGMKIDELQFYNKILDESVLSTEENTPTNTSQNNMTLFPNPVSEKVSVKVSKGDIKNIEIFNLLGQRVFSKKNVNNTTVTLDTSNLKKGMYLLRLQDNTNKMHTKKFIKN